MPIKVTIEGAIDSWGEYDDDTFNRADAHAREAIIGLYESGAKIENIAEAVQGALEDADAKAGD